MRSSNEGIPTRRSLLSRLRDWDDSESWRDFFNTYWKLIYGVAIKSGLSEVEAQEVVQETLITVSKKMPEFKYNPEIGSFKGWLLHVTRWRINDQLRKRKRDVPRAVERADATARTATIERVPDPASLDMQGVWDEEWQKSIMELAVNRVKKQVSPKQYQIFDLYVIKKWPLEKVVATLRVSAGQVYLAKHRISALVKREVEQLEDKMI